jgi:hypothetical protein
MILLSIVMYFRNESVEILLEASIIYGCTKMTSFMIYHRICNKMDATSGAGTLPEHLNGLGLVLINS